MNRTPYHPIRMTSFDRKGKTYFRRLIAYLRKIKFPRLRRKKRNDNTISLL